MSDENVKKRIGLQIGGTVGPDDEVGMHIPMPNRPGIGVAVNVDSIDSTIRGIVKDIPEDHPAGDELKIIAGKIFREANVKSKIEKIKDFIRVGAGIAQLAGKIAGLVRILSEFNY